MPPPESARPTSGSPVRLAEVDEPFVVVDLVRGDCGFLRRRGGHQRGGVIVRRPRAYSNSAVSGYSCRASRCTLLGRSSTFQGDRHMYARFTVRILRPRRADRVRRVASVGPAQQAAPPSSRPSASRARTWSGCRRRRRWSRRCSTWPRSRRRTTSWTLARAMAAPSLPRKAARARGRRIQPRHGGAVASATRRRQASPTRRVRPGDIFETDFSKATVLTLFLLPAQPEAPPDDPQHEAGHPRRLEHVHDGRLGARPDARSAAIAPAGARRYLWIVPAKVQGRGASVGGR